ncbi:MAG: hypothetical protein GX379_02930 [Clostridiales bacterium]|jgi:hypothetical protein|nr:hypothetical protein [Clostridiales bacterium]
MKSKVTACPICKSNHMYLKHEASYVYSYVLDSDAPGMKNTEIFSPFLYDRRDQTSSCEYVECDNCKTRFTTDLLYGALNTDHNDISDRFK